MFFPKICTSCGGCKIICKQNAIIEKKREIGKKISGFSKNIELVYGQLNIGEPMAIPIIKAVKNYIIVFETVIMLDIRCKKAEKKRKKYSTAISLPRL